MNVASLELSKRLYELSGWYDTDYVYHDIISAEAPRFYTQEKYRSFSLGYNGKPAYDLGYLLRKLPPAFTWETQPRKGENGGRLVGANVYMELVANGNVKFIIASVGLTTVWWQSYGTPEDAAARLAIELFEQHILTPESKEGENHG